MLRLVGLVQYIQRHPRPLDLPCRGSCFDTLVQSKPTERWVAGKQKFLYFLKLSNQPYAYLSHQI